MASQKSGGLFSRIRPWLSLQRHRSGGRALSRRIRESLLLDVNLSGVDDGSDEGGWIVRKSEGSSNTTIDYVQRGDRELVRFTVKLLPCNCPFLRSVQTVQLSADGAVVPLPLLARLLLRNVVRLFLVRYGDRIADAALGN